MSSLDGIDHVCLDCGKIIALKYDRCWRCDQKHDQRTIDHETPIVKRTDQETTELSMLSSISICRS